MQPKTWVSLLILLVLVLHALPVLSYQGHRQTRWPFLAWAMYAKSYPPGPIEATTRHLIGTTASGKEEEVTAQHTGLPGPAFRNAYIAPLWKGDSAPAFELIHRLNRGRADPVVQLRLEGERQILADTGVVTEELPTLVYRADPAALR